MIRTTLAIGTAGLVLLTVAGPASSAPGPVEARQGLSSAAPAAAATTQPAEIVNDEVVLAELDATGLPERAVLISRVTVHGPQREVIDPASGANVRYLDRLGRPEVGPDGVILVVGGERTSALTEARFDKPLPGGRSRRVRRRGVRRAGRHCARHRWRRHDHLHADQHHRRTDHPDLHRRRRAGAAVRAARLHPVPGDAHRDPPRGRRPGRGPGRDAGHRRAGPDCGAVEHLPVPADQHPHPDSRPHDARRPGRGARSQGRDHPSRDRPGPGHRVLLRPAHRRQRGQRHSLRGARRAGRGGRGTRPGLRPAGDRAGWPGRRGERCCRRLRVAGQGRGRSG